MECSLGLSQTGHPGEKSVCLSSMGSISRRISKEVEDE